MTDYRKFKKEVMDPVSDTFCAAKWLNSTIWLNQGSTASCHHPAMHNIAVDALTNNPAALHNTDTKKAARAEMMAGKRPSECDYCWRVEDTDTTAISDRTFKTFQFSKFDIDAVVQSPDQNHNPKSLEIAFDRVCNFACSYCSATFSTTWARDIKQNGPYKNHTTDDRKHYQTDAPWAQPYLHDDDNPYITAFWKWWPDLANDLDEIRITGGEPLMSTSVWKMFDWFETHPDTSMRLSINTNLGAKDSIIKQLIDKSKNISNLSIYTSCEAYGKQAEYIRDGLDYSAWLNNMNLIGETSNISLNVMMTINALCLFSITDFLDDLCILKSKFGKSRVLFSVNIMRYPQFQSIDVLPDDFKQLKSTEIQAWLDNNSQHLVDFERSHVERLIKQLQIVNKYDRTDLIHDFKSFFSEYDIRRGKSLETVFPLIGTVINDNDNKNNIGFME